MQPSPAWRASRQYRIYSDNAAVKGAKLPKQLLIPFSLVTKDNVDNFVAIADRVYVK